jgi:hypothetical protein
MLRRAAGFNWGWGLLGLSCDPVHVPLRRLFITQSDFLQNVQARRLIQLALILTQHLQELVRISYSSVSADRKFKTHRAGGGERNRPRLGRNFSSGIKPAKRHNRNYALIYYLFFIEQPGRNRSTYIKLSKQHHEVISTSKGS